MNYITEADRIKIAKNPDKQLILRYVCDAGLFIRGQLRRYLDRLNWQQDKVTIECEEDKGWIDSEFRITMRGPAAICYSLACRIGKDWKEE